jgi:uncharacterized membrane protein YedE/YeeE
MDEAVPVSRETGIKRSVKKRKNQLPAALVVLALIIGFAALLGGMAPGLAVAWIFGIGFGVVLQKSRFCFTAAFRDPVLTGGTSLSKAVLLAIGIALIGFAAIQFFITQGGKGIPGAVNPAGIHVAIGATMFGIGAVISGGCASGTLMRVGEGFMMQWLSLVFFVVGSLWGARDFGWWTQAVISASPKIHLPSVLGWPMALVLQLAVLVGLYFLADRWGKRKSNG